MNDTDRAEIDARITVFADAMLAAVIGDFTEPPAAAIRAAVRKGITALAPQPAAQATLFESGRFQLHGGEQSDWIINCAALTDADLATLARIAVEIVGPFGSVYGIPRGGERFATELWRHAKAGHPRLVVDDVLTSGGSMRETMRADDKGLVIFARGPLPPNVTALFAYPCHSEAPVLPEIETVAWLQELLLPTNRKYPGDTYLKCDERKSIVAAYARLVAERDEVRTALAAATAEVERLHGLWQEAERDRKAADDDLTLLGNSSEAFRISTGRAIEKLQHNLGVSEETLIAVTESHQHASARADALAAELARIRAQQPVAWMSDMSIHGIRWAGSPLANLPPAGSKLYLLPPDSITRAEHEALKGELAALRKAVNPFVAIVYGTSGRIPTERLSFANWHDLTKAFGEFQRLPDVVPGQCPHCGDIASEHAAALAAAHEAGAAGGRTLATKDCFEHQRRAAQWEREAIVAMLRREWRSDVADAVVALPAPARGGGE